MHGNATAILSHIGGFRMLGEPLSVHLPGLVVDQDPKNDHQGSQAAEEGHRVAKKYHREPD